MGKIRRLVPGSLMVSATLAGALFYAAAVARPANAAGFKEGDPVPVNEFHVVTPDLYRGGRPSREALEILSGGGVRTLLNLEDDTTAVAQEQLWAKELGLNEVSVPLNSFKEPHDLDVQRIFRVLTDPAFFPVYVHCRHGQDRTGLIVGLYRVIEQDWKPKDAYAEMLQKHFHTSLFGLDLYFARETGFIGPTWFRMRWKGALPRQLEPK